MIQFIPPALSAICLGTLMQAVDYAPHSAAIDAVATQLSLTEVQRHPDLHGSDLLGTLPGGVRVEIDIDHDGSVDKIETRGRSLAPLADIAALLPAAVTSAAQFPADALFEEIDFDRTEIEIEGRLADGTAFDATFATDGTLLDWDR